MRSNGRRLKDGRMASPGFGARGELARSQGKPRSTPVARQVPVPPLVTGRLTTLPAARGGFSATPVAGIPRSSSPGDPVLAHLAVEIGAVDPEPGRRLGHVPARLLERLADRFRLAALDLAPEPGALLARPSGLEPGGQVLGPDVRSLDQ